MPSRSLSLNPLGLLVLVWLSVLAISMLAAELRIVAFGDLAYTTLAVLLLSVAAWGCGHLLYELLLEQVGPRVAPPKVATIHRGRALAALVCLLTLSILGFTAFLETWTVVDLLYAETPEGALLAVNQRIAEEGTLFGGLLGRLYVLPVVGLAYTSYLVANRTIHRGAGLLVGLCFIFMLVSPRRALLLQGILLAVFVYQATAAGRRSNAPLIAALLATLAIFGFTQIALAKADASLSAVLGSVVAYVAANVPTMDELLRSSHFADTQVLLNVPYRAVNAIFGTRYQVELAVPFVDVGVPSNTVPFQYYLHKSAGLPAVVAISLLLGSLANAIHRIAMHRVTFFWIWLKSAFLVFILFSFREFTLITYDWIFFLLVASILSATIQVRSTAFRAA